MKKLILHSLYTIGVLTVAAGIYSILCSNSQSLPKDDELEKADRVLFTPPPTPEELTLFGERMPLEYGDVYESLDREIFTNCYYHSSTIRIVKSMPRYFPIIKPILEEEGVPTDFIYLSVAESALNPFAVSSAGAVGFWQFMKNTAPEYGLEVTNEVDERYHLEKSTRAACAYFKKSYQKLGSWTLVAASFNAGNSGVTREINRQKQKSYYDLWLNSETARYVFRIAALKTILENPVAYGFYIPEDMQYKPFETREVKVTNSIASFPDWCIEQGTNYKIFKTLNPWIRSDKLDNPTGKTYLIKLPISGKRI